MQMKMRFESKRARIKAVAVVAAGGVALALAVNSADAQTSPNQCSQAGKDCTFTISSKSIQKVPTLFKLQAQIAQAKMPVGDATFAALTVKVKNGSTDLCSEPFTQVRVRSGVLNLEIGRKIQGCQLDDVVAKYNDLAFQICIGDSGTEAGNCLKPIQLSSVPYALKANFASQSQEAYRAELASRSNYAQRLTSDGSMLEQQQLGSGYYDFQKPDAAKLGILTAVNSADSAAVKGGFVQWTAVDPLDRVLNFSAKNPSSNDLERLSRITFHSQQSNFWGKLGVLDMATFSNGITALAGGVDVRTNATFSAGVLATAGGVDVRTPSSFSAGILATAGLVDVRTDASFSKGIAVSGGQGTFASGITVNGAAGTFTSGIGVSGGQGTFASGITVNGAAGTFTSGIGVSGGQGTFGAGITVNGATGTFSNGITLTGGSMNVQTSSSFGKAGMSTSVSYVSGTTVDMTAATVLLPSNIVVTPAANTIPAAAIQNTAIQNRHIGLTFNALAADSVGTTDCVLSSAALSTKFCGITKTSPRSGAATPSCTILPVATGFRLQACGASCAASCF